MRGIVIPESAFSVAGDGRYRGMARKGHDPGQIGRGRRRSTPISSGLAWCGRQTAAVGCVGPRRHRLPRGVEPHAGHRDGRHRQPGDPILIAVVRIGHPQPTRLLDLYGRRPCRAPRGAGMGGPAVDPEYRPCKAPLLRSGAAASGQKEYPLAKCFFFANLTRGGGRLRRPFLPLNLGIITFGTTCSGGGGGGGRGADRRGGWWLRAA